MLTSLFGDLGSLRETPRRDAALGDEPDAGFAATTILESVATEAPWRAKPAAKWATSPGTSSGRSRKGGTSSGTTFSR